MATNDANQPKLGRQLALQVVHTLRANISFDDPSLGGQVGILPAGAIILTGQVFVSTAFNTGTLNVGKVGGDADEYASALALSQAIVAFDDLAIGNQVIADDTTVTFARSAAATSGSASIVITYSVDNG